jgi:hypothetical protein
MTAAAVLHRFADMAIGLDIGLRSHDEVAKN